MRPEPFRQNVVIVTGASSGIGRHVVLQLAEQGAWLAIAARNVEELDRVAELCRQRGGRAIAVATDVSDPKQCRALVERSVEEYGRIDTLINNAGVGMRARFDELHDMCAMETIMRVNYWGSAYCTHYALPHLKATKGRIIVVVSGGGRFVTPNACGYGASKHALVGLFDTLRVELSGSGVSVTAIYPEWVATGISARASGADGRPVGDIAATEHGAMAPEACARQIVKAAARRKRQTMTPKSKLGLVFAPILPGVVDRIATRVFTGDRRGR